MKLIDKDKVVEEIERQYAYFYRLHEQRIIEKILSIINSLEVKEVNLEKEIENLLEKENAFVVDDRNREVYYNNGVSFNHIYDLELIAKHFFELGLKTQRGE